MRASGRLQPDRPLMLFVESQYFPSRESYATWLFDFLRVDFATMPSGQTQDWQREAKAFVDLGEGAVIELSRGGGLQTGEQLPAITFLRSMQQQLRTGLETLWLGKGHWLRPPIKTQVARIGRHLIESRQGSFRNLFVNAMQQMVIESWTRIRTCPRCSSPFLKVRKQSYCTPSCSQKTRSARFAGKRPRDYQREYERAVKKKLGTTAKLKLGRRKA